MQSSGDMTGLQALPTHRTVGDYVVQGLLGRTPWATTYAGYNEREGPVAIKLLSVPETASPTLLDELEGALLHVARSLLPSDAICPRDGGEDEASGQPFVVTSLCTLPSLFDLVATSPLSIDEVAVLLTRIGKTLSGGIPHLGLRPNNVFVGPPSSQEVLLSDFGFDVLRRAHYKMAAERSGVPLLDRTWLAPEQGVSAVADPARVDVYSAALVAVYALSGMPLPCDEHGVERISIDEHAAACGLSIPPELVRVLSRALEVDPLARFGTVAELAEAFAAVPHARTEDSMLGAVKRHEVATGRVRKYRLPNEAVHAQETMPAPPGVVQTNGSRHPADADDDRTLPGMVEMPPASELPEAPREAKKVGTSWPQKTMKLASFKLRSGRPSALPTAPPPPGFHRPDEVSSEKAEPAPAPNRTQLLPRFQLQQRPAGADGASTDPAPPPSVHEVATVKRPRFVLVERLGEFGARKLLAVAGVSVCIAITSTIVAIVALLRSR